MNAKDLRIGNFWDTGDFYGIDRVESYNIYQLSLMEKGSTVADFYHHVKPIPLTEEWLLEFGFEAFRYNFRKDLDSFCMIYDLKTNTFYINDGDGYEGANILKKIQYVHQLQNLYWCLCGEELTLTNPAL
jgi:hypothetical protein